MNFQMPQLCSYCNAKPSQSIINQHCNHVLCDSCVQKSAVETKIKSQINKQINQSFFCLVCQKTVELTKEQNGYLQELISKGNKVESDFGNVSQSIYRTTVQSVQNQSLDLIRKNKNQIPQYKTRMMFRASAMNRQRTSNYLQECSYIQKNEIEHLKVQVQSMQSLNINLENQMNSYSQYMQQQQTQQQTLIQEIHQKEQEIYHQKTQNEKHQQMIQNGFIYYDAKIKSYEDALEICQNKLNQAQDKINEQQQQIQDLNQRKENSQNEYQISNLQNQVQSQQREINQEHIQSEETIQNMQMQIQKLQSENLNLKKFYNQVQMAFDCIPHNERDKSDNQKIDYKGKQI